MRLTLLLLPLTIMLTGCVSAELVTFAPGNSGALTEQELTSRNINSLELVTSDKQNIHVLHLPDEQSDILTIYFHGNGGNIHQRVGVLDYLRTLGTSVLGVSYRGYLGSTGTPTEQGVYKDAQATLDYAVDTLGYSKTKVLLLGRSLGSGVAIDLAKGEELGGVILVTPFTNPRDMLRVQRWITRLLVKNNSYLDTAFQNSEKAKLLKAFTIVIHGTADEVVPYEQGSKVYELIPGEKRLVTIDGAMHNDFGFSDSSDFDKQYWLAIEQMLEHL